MQGIRDAGDTARAACVSLRMNHRMDHRILALCLSFMLSACLGPVPASAPGSHVQAPAPEALTPEAATAEAPIFEAPIFEAPIFEALAFDALAFFEGHSEGVGTLDKMVGKTEQMRVSSEGTRLADGSLRLVQRVTQGARRERKRTWIIRETAPGRYAGTLTDAAGPVRGESDGNRLHLAYVMKGGFMVHQWLYLQPGGRVAQNRMRVSKLGMAVARLDETIRKQ